MSVRALALLLLAAVPAFGQADRYELGQRFKAFEAAWDEKAGDPAAKKRAVPLVNQAVQTILKLNLSGAAQHVDEARHALESADPAPPPVRWADSLQIVPESRVVDAATPEMTVTVRALYKVDVNAPKGAAVRLKLGAGKAVEAPLDKLPATVKVPVKDVPGTPSADFKLMADILADGKVLSTRAVGVSRVEKFAERLAAVKKAGAEVKPTTIERATFHLLLKMLDDAANKKVPETDHPNSRLIFGAERLAKVTEPYYIPSRPGEFWLSIPTGKSATVVRIRIPPKLETKTAVPVLFCLHGMGGSENLFFEGYGAGIVPRLAAERGWLVVAPRVEGLFGGAPNVPAILDELAKRYPIDPKRVYLVGHSMGAGHAVELAQKDPGRYAAVAALGGGGRVTKPEALKGVRFFVGCGTLDFGASRSRALHKELDEAKVPVTLKEYDVEHLLIVREAAADVFEFFEKKH